MPEAPRAPGGASTASGGGVELGPNAGLVDEMYRRYQDNPDSIAPVWRDFFADYTPRATAPAATTTPSSGERSGPAAAGQQGTERDGRDGAGRAERASERPSGREPQASGGGDVTTPLRGT